MNINEEVKVKLTSFGEETYTEYLSEFPVKYQSKRIDREGYLVLSLWELMLIFGKVMYMGNPRIPFVNNEIIFTSDK